ncbi:MAG: hypothetical protein O3B43_05495 [Chloroflexi bacterium]|nr:hypothetical protein [Chloroflexota bacterium]
MSRAFKLFRLQQVDSQLDLVRARLAEIEAILGEDEALRQAIDVRVVAQERKAETEKALRKAEEDVAAQQIKIDQNQATLYGGKVNNPKELQDLQQEAEAFKRHLGKLEDIQLEKMVANEEVESSLLSAQKREYEIESDRAKEHGDLGKECEVLLRDVARLAEEREASSSGVSDEDMRPYLKLRESKGGLAVAKVDKKTCGACGATLSDALAQAARSPNELNTCTSCKRILYSG